MIKGIITSIVTPMKKNKKIDFKSFKNLIINQKKNKIKNIVTSGTTGESSTLTIKEHVSLAKYAKKLVGKKINIISGSCSNSTKDCIHLNKKLKNIVDGILQIVPHYNKPNQKGIYLHFKKIADSTKLPIIIYNVPERTGTIIETKTILKLAKIKNIIGIKNSSSNLEKNIALINKFKKHNFNFYSGDDYYSNMLFVLGAKGTISVTSNVLPKVMNQIYKKIIKNKLSIEKFKKDHFKLMNIYKILFIETNPIPIKYILYKLGYIKNILRLPLTKLQNKYKKKLKKTFRKYKMNFFYKFKNKNE